MRGVAAPDEALRSVAKWELRSGLRAIEAGPDDLDDVVAVFDTTWGQGRSPDRAFYTAMALAGNPFVLVRDNGVPVGAAFAVLGWNDGLHLHSHMAAVLPDYQGRGVGALLKLAQRAIALANDIDEIRWTYDPLVLRNARFNLGRLGADVRGFHPDLYGRLGDAISGDDATDRFEVSWQLTSPRVLAALAAEAPRLWRAQLRLELPADYHALRAEDPAGAAALRARSREVFAQAFRRGLRVQTDATGYVFVDDEEF